MTAAAPSVESGTAGTAAAVAASAPAGTTAAASSHAHHLQLLTRERQRFAELEAALPTMRSLLGRDQAPAADQDVTAQDSVWLLDNVASRDGHGGWQAEYVVAVLAQQPSGGVVEAVRAVAERIAARTKTPADDAMLKTVAARLHPFLQDVLPGRRVHARHGAAWNMVLAAAARNGLSDAVEALPAASVAGTLVPTTAVVPAGTDGELSMLTLFADGTGWGVISDIDDTIKVTQTSDPVGILQTTFFDTPTPITGMPALYRFLAAAAGGASVPFFYLSASPYNLYPFLRSFREQYYPHGMLLLRDTSPMSVSGLLSTLTLGTQAYKVGRMQRVHGWLPAKNMVCIGDSTQSDPESYGEIYRTFPGWVKLILIRKVTDIAAVGITEKNEPARFDKAFAGVPSSVWHVFEDPAECYEHVRRVVGDVKEEK